jgi:hypothetical protein
MPAQIGPAQLVQHPQQENRGHGQEDQFEPAYYYIGYKAFAHFNCLKRVARNSAWWPSGYTL